MAENYPTLRSSSPIRSVNLMLYKNKIPTTMPFFSRIQCLQIPALLTAIFLALLAFVPSEAQLRIDILQGNFQPIRIAIPNSENKGFSSAQTNKIQAVIEADLNRSGLISVVDRASLIYKNLPLDVVPDFSAFRLANADAVLSLELSKARGKHKATLQIWDVRLQRPLSREELDAKSWRILAHKISDAVYQRLTGEEGYFNSRILYVSETIRKRRRWKRLAIMDYDGANHRFLTNARRTIVLNPRFAPNGRAAIYTALTKNSSSIRLIDFSRNNREKVLPLGKGLVYAGRFSPDSKKIIYANSISGNSEIFTYDLTSGRRRRLTIHPAIDTSPSFSPDGDYIAFVSDRSGRPQIYTMTSRGRNVQRVSFADGAFSTPVWSPRGDKIAFTRQLYGRFAVGAMAIDGSDMRIFTDGFRIEGPSWAPNGRVLVFFKKNRTPKGKTIARSRLLTVDVTGRFLRELATPHNAYDPSWSYAEQQ